MPMTTRTGAQTATITFDTETCIRCNGEGRIAMHRHVAGGVCAKCGGSKRQMSRKGRAAHRAYEKALTERLGRRADQIEAGQTILDSYGSRRRVDLVEVADGMTWLVTIEGTGNAKSGYRPSRLVRLYDPSAEVEIAEQIAASYPGASLTG